MLSQLDAGRANSDSGGGSHSHCFLLGVHHQPSGLHSDPDASIQQLQEPMTPSLKRDLGAPILQYAIPITVLSHWYISPICRDETDRRRGLKDGNSGALLEHISQPVRNPT